MKHTHESMSQDEHIKKNKPSRLPTLLSVVYPGIGQFAQGRPIAGICFVVVCTALVIAFCMSWMRIMIVHYRLMFDSPLPAAAPDYRSMLIWLALVLLIILASVCDAHLAFRRQRRIWSMRKHNIPPDLPDN